jgi:C4-dicarboxylate-specific signal transduction histidine kinase
LGLGMAISAAIVRGFGGTLRSQSGAVGSALVGANFVLRLRSSEAPIVTAENRPMIDATLDG